MLRPLRFSQLFDVALNATLKRFLALAGLVLVAALPVAAVQLVILATTVSDPNDITSRSVFSGARASTNGAAGVNLTVTLLSAVVTVLGTALCFKVVAAAYAGGRAEWRSSLEFAGPRIAPVLWAAFLAGAGIVLGFLALIVPGVWLLVSWSVFLPALLFEGLGPPRALGRSFELVRGRWLATLGVLIVAGLVSSVASGIVSAGFDALLSSGLGDHVFSAALIDSVGNAAASAIGLPFQAAMIAVLYFDLRARKERMTAYDVASRLGVEPTGPSPAVGVPEPEPPAPPRAEEPADTQEWTGWTPPTPPADSPAPSEWLPPRPPGGEEEP